MKKRYLLIIFMSVIMQLLYANDTVVIGQTMYQNQAFTDKDKHIFDTDWEGLRVWRWSKAQKYCETLKINGYDDWKVASSSELEALFNPVAHNGLKIKKVISTQMPSLGGKYDDVWMWTRESKEGKLGAFVNFKKATNGWADKKYKGYVLCTRKVKKLSSKQKRTVCERNARQEVTYSTNWVKAWDTCAGYTALKKDGTLWQFGKVGECSGGQIALIDVETGKPLYEEKHIYHLKPRKIGSGFHGAKFINGRYRMVAIKKDGTLWGWGEGLGVKAKKLSFTRHWLDFAIKYEGNGCCAYDVGLNKDGILWRFPEFFDYTKKGSHPKLRKISRFSDWKKIVLGCCNIYGLRKNGTLWKSEDEGNNKIVFKKYVATKKSYGGDMKLYPYLKKNMQKVPKGTIYMPSDNANEVEAKNDGTLCLLAEVRNY